MGVRRVAGVLAGLSWGVLALSLTVRAQPAGTTLPQAPDPGQTPNAYVGGEKDFEDMSRQERDAAKTAARSRKFEMLRVCADPGDLPFSDDQETGFENKIAQVLAKQMGTRVNYAWRPTFERGLTRQTMSELNLCDVMIGVPTDYEALLTTTPLYRSTYVFAYRTDKIHHIVNLDDPQLKSARIGVYETSGLRNALSDHGITQNVVVMGTSHDADLVPEHQPWRQVEQVVKGELDLAGVWGPFAGWVQTTQHAPIVLQPTNLMDDNIPMEFSVAIGVPKYAAVLKYALEDAMEATKDQITSILASYGVPLVQCSDCLISGSIPAHGDYIVEGESDESAERPLERTKISQAQVDEWLKQGSSVNDELDNAALSADIERVKYLLTKKGVNINNRGNDGETPLHLAVINGDEEMMGLLLDHKADADQADGDGYTPLALAASRNKTSAIKLLVARGAKLEVPIPGGYSPLFVATAQGKLAASQELIGAGAKCNIAQGPQHLTLLMAVATQTPPERRIMQVVQVVDPAQLAQQLIQHGADVNAVTTQGTSALMIAAAHDNAPMIGVLIRAGARAEVKGNDGQTAMDIATQNGNDSAIRALQLFQASGSQAGARHDPR